MNCFSRFIQVLSDLFSPVGQHIKSRLVNDNVGPSSKVDFFFTLHFPITFPRGTWLFLQLILMQEYCVSFWNKSIKYCRYSKADKICYSVSLSDFTKEWSLYYIRTMEIVGPTSMQASLYLSFMFASIMLKCLMHPPSGWPGVPMRKKKQSTTTKK